MNNNTRSLKDIRKTAEQGYTNAQLKLEKIKDK